MKKTILITGATNGMGKAAAMTLAKQGHQIIIHGRNEKLAQEVRQQIISESGNPDVDYLTADLYRSSDIKKLAENFGKKYEKLDVLINNAGGIMSKKREVTVEGIEKTIALNLLAPYLLTSLLLPKLQRSPTARIVNMASVAYRTYAKPDFKDLEMEQTYSVNSAYGNAKLYLIIISLIMGEMLQEKFKGSLTINMVHPGAVMTQALTQFLSQNGFFGKILSPIMRLLAKTPEQGADTIIYLATSDEVKNKNGLYFINRKPSKIDQKYISDKTKKIIWDYCETKTGEKFMDLS